MGILSSLRAPSRRVRSGAAFPAADLGRLTSSWTVDPGAINRWLRYELRTLRARSRQLTRGDGYGAKFVGSCMTNIAGARPFILQSKARFTGGGLNKTANEAIETAHITWSKRGRCEVTGKLSLGQLHRLVIRTVARDGEALVRKVRGPQGLRLQILDIDRLDEQRNENLPSGAIKMGVQVDLYGRAVAYHLLKQHPGELGEWSRGAERDHEIVPADQIEHIFVPDWPEQVRGVPWLHAGMLRLWHLGAFEEAAVINARIGATKMAVLQSPNGEPPESMATGKDSQGNLLLDAEPGGFWTLPEGVQIGSFDPAFPDQAIGPFMQACLRGIAASVGMAYHSLANDPSAVNFSTARVALLEERDMWMALQEWYVDSFVEPIFGDWLQMEITRGTLPSAYGKFQDSARFQPRRWDWVDPSKDITAKKDALESKLTSRTRIAAEHGDDIEDIFEELAEEDQLAADYKIDLAPANAKPQAPSATEPADTGDTAGESEAQAAAGKAMEGVLRAAADMVTATAAVTVPRETKVNVGETIVHVHNEGPKGPTVRTVIAERRADGKLVAEVTEQTQE